MPPDRPLPRRACRGTLLALTALAAAATLGGCARPDPATFWQDYADRALSKGHLRTDRLPADAPVDAARIARSFEQIGFSFEADPFFTGQQVVEPRMIRKWTEPIAYTLIGESDDLDRLRAVLDPVVADLRGLTGHAIAELGRGAAPAVADTPNLFVLFGRDDLLAALRAYDELLRDGSVSPDPLRGDALLFLNRLIDPWYGAASPCAGQVFLGDGEDGTDDGEVLFAVVMIRFELPDVLLEACVEEELAQLMGLFDDDPSLRPSVFNDDQEFALLTGHDRLLLRILYDPGLRIGMTPDEAMPVVRRLAQRLAKGLAEGQAGGLAPRPGGAT